MVLDPQKENNRSTENHKYTMADDGEMLAWAAACEKSGCPPGFVAVTMVDLCSRRTSVKMPLELATLWITQGHRVDSELFVDDNNAILNVLLAYRNVEQQPGQSDEEHNKYVACSFDVLKLKLPDDVRLLVESTIEYDTYPPLGCPVLNVSSTSSS